MSALVLVLCVLCYFVANIYQNKFSATLENRIFPMNCFQMLWMAMAIAAFAVFELLTDGFQFSTTTITYGMVAGVITLLGSLCLLGALSKGPLSLTILIFSMYVVVPPVLAMIFLGEKATICQLIGIARKRYQFCIVAQIQTDKFICIAVKCLKLYKILYTF